MDSAQLRQQTELDIAQYESYAQADPDNHLIWLKLGDLNHSVSRLERARECYERCLTLSPEDAVVRGRLASLLITQHQFAEAENRLRTIIDAGETDPALHHNLGITLFYQERWPEAEECFQAALDAGLRGTSTLSYLCQALHYQERLDEAVAACREWIEAEDSTEGRGILALLEMDRKNMAEAEQIAAEVLASSPDDINAGNVMGTASLERQEVDRAQGHFERILGNRPDNGRAWLGLGLTQLYRSQYDKAIKSLEKSAELMPTNAGAVVTLGWAFLAKQDFEGAERAFRNAVEVDRNFSESHAGLATALAYQRKIAEAESELERARRLDPEGFGTDYARGILSAVRGETGTATQQMSEFLQRAPEPGHKTLLEQVQYYFQNRPAGKRDPQDRAGKD